MTDKLHFVLIVASLMLIADAQLWYTRSRRYAGCPANVNEYKSRAQDCQSPFRSLPSSPSFRQVCRKFKEAEPCMKRLHSYCSSLRPFVNTQEYQWRQELRQVC